MCLIGRNFPKINASMNSIRAHFPPLPPPKCLPKYVINWIAARPLLVHKYCCSGKHISWRRRRDRNTKSLNMSKWMLNEIGIRTMRTPTKIDWGAFKPVMFWATTSSPHFHYYFLSLCQINGVRKGKRKTDSPPVLHFLPTRTRKLSYFPPSNRINQ